MQQTSTTSGQSGKPQTMGLETAVQFVSGVGPKRAALLGNLGIKTVGDLICHFPFRHQQHDKTTIADLRPGNIGTVIAKIVAFRPRRHHKGPALMATVADNTGRASVTWFNAGWVMDKLRNGAVVRLTGKVGQFGGLPQMVNPKFIVMSEDAEPIKTGQSSSTEGVYPATGPLNSAAIARIIRSALPRALPAVEEWYPQAFRAARELPPRRTAIERMHRPTRQDDLDIARRRLAYDELLVFQVAVQMARRRRVETMKAAPLACSDLIDGRIRKRLPFALTAAQNEVLVEITADLARDRPMNRLLQGDVGSGKTAVALYAALVAVANKRQAALLAPTELLAEQHHRNITDLLADAKVRHALWTGGGTRARRAQLRARAAAGELDLVVGTQALLQDDIQFMRLGLVIVDEQHRFGVRQRAILRGKGESPHYLVMTATPIPRSLAMTVFGDLDVSTIDELPPGRSTVSTKLLLRRDHEHAWTFVRARIAAGEQAYVVYPRVEEKEDSNLKAATDEAARLADGAFADARVALLHGRMTSDEKEAVMRRFAAGEADVLVATTVVEVGIDVPNATVMVIQHADRYGLAQLHQLRGRVGRGEKAGYCYLLSDSRDAEENQRLAVLASTTDGFRIAEEDLKLRGPGELLGTRQHGLPEFKVADLLRDGELLKAARKDAKEIVQRDPELAHADWRVFRAAVMTGYAARMNLLDAG
jgi:ATP-dependent DNA helicase RecG